LVGVAGFGIATPNQSAPDTVVAMVDQVFADVPEGEQPIAIFKDDIQRVYLAFYMSTYADVKELRAYAITFRNVNEFVADTNALDELLAQGQLAEAFDGLLAMMRLDRGSQYVSDVGLDGVHEGDVAVGQGFMRDRFHDQVFAGYSEANEAYMKWLAQAVALSHS
jgi:hypothetical protein